MTSFHWCDRGFTVRVRDQKGAACSLSCAAAVAVEGLHFVRTQEKQFKKLVGGSLIDLSEQQLIDRCPVRVESACLIKEFSQLFKSIPGITTVDTYPLNELYAKEEYKIRQVIDPIVWVDGLTPVTPQGSEDLETALEVAVNEQPVLAVMICGQDFTRDLKPDKVYRVHHKHGRKQAVVVMGYGIEGGREYWSILHSMGKDWSADGYIRIEKGVGAKGLCGIAAECFVPNLGLPTASWTRYFWYLDNEFTKGTQYNWLHKGFKVRVRDQHLTGYCLACAAVVAIEGMHFASTQKKVDNMLVGGNLLDLSEQHIMDMCKAEVGKGGVELSTFLEVFKRIPGLTTVENYPIVLNEGGNYRKQQYQKFKVKEPIVWVTGWKKVEPEKNEEPEAAIERAVRTQPVLAVIRCDENFYVNEDTAGVDRIYDIDSRDGSRHAVVITGYGFEENEKEEKKKEYWIILNSMGKRWGKKGYIRIKKGVKGRGLLGIASECYVPIPGLPTISNTRYASGPNADPEASSSHEKKGTKKDKKRRRPRRK